MTIILIVAILIFIIGIVWTWHNLGNIEKPRKILFIFLGILIIFLITRLIYSFSSTNIIYPTEEIQKTITNTLVMIFTGLNTLIFLPFIANITDKILEEEIENGKAKKRIIIFLIFLIICIFVEKGYFNNTQEGIINMYNEVQNAEE